MPFSDALTDTDELSGSSPEAVSPQDGLQVAT